MSPLKNGAIVLPGGPEDEVQVAVLGWNWCRTCAAPPLQPPPFNMIPFLEDLSLLEQNLDIPLSNVCSSPSHPWVLGKGSPIHPGAQARDLEACVTTLSFAHPPRPIHQQILLALIPKHIPILRFSLPHSGPGLTTSLWGAAQPPPRLPHNPPTPICTAGRGSF